MATYRLHNETKEDQEREEIARRIVEQYRDKVVTKLPDILYRIDWAVADSNGVLTCYGEYKWRRRHYPTVMLSAAKYANGRVLAEAADVPFRLFIEWPHGIHWADMPPGLPTIMGGRKDRGQVGDWEPMVCMVAALFRPLTPKAR